MQKNIEMLIKRVNHQNKQLLLPLKLKIKMIKENKNTKNLKLLILL